MHARFGSMYMYLHVSLRVISWSSFIARSRREEPLAIIQCNNINSSWTLLRRFLRTGWALCKISVYVLILVCIIHWLRILQSNVCLPKNLGYVRDLVSISKSASATTRGVGDWGWILTIIEVKMEDKIWNKNVCLYRKTGVGKIQTQRDQKVEQK